MTQRNKNLHAAKRGKKDEFYTQITDVEKELRHYKKHLKNKTVICNCDDPSRSAFIKHLALKFDDYKLKRIISTHYGPSQLSFMEPHQPPYMLQIDKEVKNVDELDESQRIPLEGNGDFRSEECIMLLREADIAITNPPFSLFREYVGQLIKYEKKFIIIGHQNAITYKEIFPLIRDNKLWLGHGFKGNVGYFINEHYEDYATAANHKEGMIRVSGVQWFTNLKIKKRKERLILVEKYKGNEADYPKYDNYDAIEVSKVVNIPKNYDGVMGVPITFMNKYNPKQFELIGMGEDNGIGHSGGVWQGGSKSCLVNGKATFKRIFIRRR